MSCTRQTPRRNDNRPCTKSGDSVRSVRREGPQPIGSPGQQGARCRTASGV